MQDAINNPEARYEKTVWLMLIWMAAGSLYAETGQEGWLRYAPMDKEARAKYDALPASCVVLGESPVLASAQEEMIRGVRGMLGRTLRAEKGAVRESSIVLGTFRSLGDRVPGFLSIATGTGFAGQYAPAIARVYESLETTPDSLLLWFHHVLYDYRLKSGKTVIQHVYDSHYWGWGEAGKYVEAWKSLEGRIDEPRFDEILGLLEFQAGHARVWRDAVCDWFHKMSGIPDSAGRVGHHPDRVEAESMELTDYEALDIIPWENSSGGRGIECARPEGCSAGFRFDRASGWYDMGVEYFDMPAGISKFQVFVNDQIVDAWAAGNRLPARRPGGDSSSSRRIPGLALRTGDTVRIKGIPDQKDNAALDFISLRERQ